MQKLTNASARPKSLAGEVGQRLRLKAQAVPAGNHREPSTAAQDRDHLHPFGRFGIGLCNSSVDHRQPGLLASFGEESNGRGSLIDWQDQDYYAVRLGPEDAIRVANDPQCTVSFRKAKDRQAALDCDIPLIESRCRPGQTTQRQNKNCGR